MRAVAHRSLRFAVVGVAGFFVDAGMLALTIGFAGPWWGRGLSFIAAVFATWTLNRGYTFADRQSGLSRWHELGRYALAMLGGGAVNYALYGLIISGMGHTGLWPYAAVAIGSLCGMMINLTLARYAVYRHAADKS